LCEPFFDRSLILNQAPLLLWGWATSSLFSGSVDGDEVVQLYAKLPEASVRVQSILSQPSVDSIASLCQPVFDKPSFGSLVSLHEDLFI
jgi:hypothetical protein